MKAPERGGIISKLIVLILVLSFCGLVYLVRRPLLRFAGGLCIAEDSLAKSDTIVVLSDDNFNADRSARAAELFRAGWAPRIVASGRRLRPYASVAELMAHDLTDRGIPKDADRKSTRLNSSHSQISYAVFCLKKKKKRTTKTSTRILSPHM